MNKIRFKTQWHSDFLREIYQCKPTRPKSWSKELTEKLQSILRSEFVGACIHFHKPNGRLASANGHSLPLTACSWQSAFYSLSGDEKLPFSVFHDIYKIEQWKPKTLTYTANFFKGVTKIMRKLAEKIHFTNTLT